MKIVGIKTLTTGEGKAPIDDQFTDAAKKIREDGFAIFSVARSEQPGYEGETYYGYGAGIVTIVYGFDPSGQWE